MAITFAVTSLVRNVIGDSREHSGLLTATGTVTADGDTVTAAQFGFSLLRDLIFSTPFVDSTTSPAAAFPARFTPNAGLASGKVTFWGTNAVPGAAIADIEVTAATSLTGYSARFVAKGR